MPRSQLEVEALLQRLECVLRQCQLWSSKVPSERALTSQAPFACDTLDFHQWLQFIFIPKLAELVKNNKSLANGMGLLPMGELTIIDTTHRHLVLPVLAQIDQVFED